MDGVGYLMTQGSGELLRILYEIQQRIDNVHVPARSCERVWLSFVYQVELERMVVSRLRRSGNGVCNRSQLIVQRGRFDDFGACFQLIKDFPPQLRFRVLILAQILRRCRLASGRRLAQQRRDDE